MSSFSASLVDLATVDVPDPCGSRPANGGTETVCADRFHLAPSAREIVQVIAPGNFYTIDALIRGPDSRQLEEQVHRLVDTVSFDP